MKNNIFLKILMSHHLFHKIKIIKTSSFINKYSIFTMCTARFISCDPFEGKFLEHPSRKTLFKY